MVSLVLSSVATEERVYGPSKLPSSYSLSRNALHCSLSDIYFPSTSVSFFLHMVNAFKDELFWTFVIKTLIWVGLRSSPDVVN